MQKFAKGGYTGDGLGNPIDETGYRVAGVVHEGEYVIPKATRRLPIVIITPAISTPRRTAITPFLNPKSRSDAARVPVHAPVS